MTKRKVPKTYSDAEIAYVNGIRHTLKLLEIVFQREKNIKAHEAVRLARNRLADWNPGNDTLYLAIDFLENLFKLK